MADDIELSDCEKEAYKYYPDPNFQPRSGGGTGPYGTQGGRTDFTSSVPSASDYDRAKQNRKKFIAECKAGNAH